MASPHLSLLPSPRTAVLHDGSAVTIRALVPEDRALIADAFERLSATSRYMRFLAPMPSLPKRMLDALMDVDHDRHVALVALQDGRAVGVVRYVRDDRDPASADVAITVIDPVQGRGLGHALMLALLDVAHEREVGVLTFDIHPENRPMQRLAKSIGTKLVFRDGTIAGRLELAPRDLKAAA
jgi:RimJ/RimL family protein N-acetyltransferase